MATEFSDVQWTAYSVQGETLADVVAAISTLPEAGKAEWNPRYDYETDENGTVNEVTVIVGWTITMPQWDGYDAASDSAKGEWDRFYAALEAHEMGHLALADQYLRELDQQMIGKTVDEAKSVFESTLQALQAESDAYDHRTDHGRNDGTNIDVDA